jgi:ATP-dependent exoDNAse (exonuclease V) beta subunit
MARVRASVPGWIAMADRVPPAELLDRVIAESAYEFELAGPRARQARENLKKIRALVRRIQNRGYTTLARVTEHLDRLSAGDESNAAFDAVDAVNLMTVHAAKGLEFPIVILCDPTAPLAQERPSRHIDPERHVWLEPLAGCVPIELRERAEEAEETNACSTW